MSISIYLIAPLPPPYGGISHWAKLIESHAQLDPEINISLLDTAARWRKVHNFSIFKRVIFGGFHLMLDCVRLIKHMKNIDCNVIHLTTSGGLAVVRDLLIILIAKLFKVPVVYHLHFGRLPAFLNKKFDVESIFISLALRKATAVIAIDNRTTSVIKNKLPSVNVKFIPNGIDLRPFKSLTYTPSLVKTAMFLGWVINSKGICELLESWSHLSITNWQLKVVGPCDDDFQRYLRLRFSFNNIIFVGEVPHAVAMELLASCDLFVLPSYTEGFPNVILEAMALGKAIIASDVGAMNIILADDCGVLIQPRSVKHLDIAMKKLMESSSFRKTLGDNAKARVETFYDIDIVFRSYKTIWLG